MSEESHHRTPNSPPTTVGPTTLAPPPPPSPSFSEEISPPPTYRPILAPAIPPDPQAQHVPDRKISDPCHQSEKEQKIGQNLPNLDESSLEVDQKLVLPEMGHSTDKDSIAESGFVEASDKTGNGFVSFVKKEDRCKNKEPLSLTLSAAESGFVEASANTESGFVTLSAAESGFVKASANTESGFVSFVKEVEGEDQELPLPLASSSSASTGIKRKRLQFDDIRKHFDVPINVAAKKMKVGVTLLKNRCRELNITRWPHRKLSSLTVLINNRKEMGLTNEVAMLEKKKKMLEKFPKTELNEKIKKLRQACFKATYKKRRLVTLNP